MFYSQFILAKKGPLGTIWIAAHLERKLRKNQVADTDIGVSVDSIIFPDMPIALRLSSHLLLGVVRIYSRKVGYLFDDCSEALLKIKQAFRSAAVDLPPEESTAPYHSITLPETFDLDDFELPDSDIFQGNYVDHHVSAKEQITLQDTMDGVVFSTSQFGPDERFGDGDNSQIGLDLNEDSLLGKAATPMNDGAFDDDDPQASFPPMTPFEADDNNDGITSDALRMMLENDDGNQVDILDRKPESSEYAEAPATPMLVEEANLSSVQEALISDDHVESEAHNILGEMEVKEADTASEFVDHVSKNGALPSHSHPEPEKPVLSVSQCPNGEMEVFGSTEGIQNGSDIVEVTSMCIDDQTEMQKTENLEGRPDECVMRSSCSPKKSSEDAVCQLGSLHSSGVADGVEAAEELKNQETGSVTQKDMQAKIMHGLHPCTSNISHHTSDENHTLQPALNGKVIASGGELLDQFYNEALKDQSGNDKNNYKNVNLDPLAPEKLLSAPDFSAARPNDLLVESTPNMESLVEGRKHTSGRKRSLPESAMTMQSDSVESFGLSQSLQTGESIPDDDDLLSSILVGRRSSGLKIKPTPAPLEVISSKRPRISQRASASKRKVLMDETMVLLGDMIRQQLMSTEDLRRVRKKAPCTLSEISVIQRQFLEDEIFTEPTLPGLSTELFYMHKETFDVSRTKICEATKASSVCTDVTVESDKTVDPMPVRNDGDVQDADTLPHDQNLLDEEKAPDSRITESEALVAQHDYVDETDKMEVDEVKADESDVTSHFIVSGHDTQVPIDSLPEDMCNVRDNSATQVHSLEKEGDAHSSHLSPENGQSLGKDSSEVSVLMGADGVSELRAHDLVAEAEPHSGMGGLVDAETDFALEECNIPSDHGDISSGTALAIAEEHKSLVLGEDDEDAEKHGKSSADVVGGTDVQCSTIANDDFGPSLEHEEDINRTSLIDDVGAAAFPENLGAMDVEATHGPEDLETVAFGHDTEFLNVDDDEVDEDNEHVSDVEDSRLLDNSGWSSRTRAVAKYLQTLFDKEAVRGKSVLPMDNLLAGKTRKEASRMFFESLVLKTRDYIQVEQGKPFDNINMKPRAKLMKSQF